MGSLPVTQGQGERKRDQEKMQALHESVSVLQPALQAPGRQAGEAQGWGSSLPSSTPSPDSEDTEAKRGIAAHPGLHSPPLEGT